MVEAELKVLSIIGENNPSITQRYLSAKTDLSLGAINVLLNKMVSMGLIKIERLNARSIRYMLTPQGMMEKAKKTYAYVRRTYENVMLMKNELERVVESLSVGSTLYLFGEEDEIYHMVVMLLQEITVDKQVFFTRITSVDLMGDGVVLIWNPADGEKLADIRHINILDRIV